MQNDASRQPVIIMGMTVLCLSIFSIYHYAFPKHAFAKKLDIWADLTKRATYDSTYPVSVTTSAQKQTAFTKTKHPFIEDFTNNNHWEKQKLFMRQAMANDTVCHILWFGDSFIEADYITGIIREKLQSNFGGIGTGFVPIHELAASLRNSCTHDAHGDWEHKVATKNDGLTPFINNQYSLAKSNASFSISTKNTNENQTVLSIWHGKANTLSNIIINDSLQESLQLIGNNPINKTTFFAKQKINNAIVNVPENTTFFGFEIGNNKGVQLHNISLRGSSGIHITQVDSTILQNINTILQPQIIVLQYGANVAENNNTNITWYANVLENIITKINSHFPNAVIVIIGMADKASKRNGVFETDDAIEKIVAMQQALAEKHNAVFINLYEAMGGKNSMKEWVEGNPSFAYKDYTHLNPAGNNKMSAILYKTLF